MIVVEGPDGAGKSTLVRKIQEKFMLKEETYIGERNDMYRDTKARTYPGIAEAVQGYDLPKVFDRIYFSELIYGPLQRGRCAFALTEQYTIEGVLKALGCPIIICLPPQSVVKENVMNSAKGQMEGVPQIIDRIYERYLGLLYTWQMQGSQMCRYDYTDASGDRALPLDVVMERIEGYLDVRKARQWR